MIAPQIEIAPKVLMPTIGLGLWQNKDPEVIDRVVQDAYEAGYRHFDSAQVYGNEGMLGDALIKHSIPRQNVFITTKISVFHLNKVQKSFSQSLKKLRTNYVDLLLIHFPVPVVRNSAWRHLEDMQNRGHARTIGVSNYTIRHLKDLMANSSVKPAVNQVELHVFLQQPELLEFCRLQGITVEAYSPLAHGYGLDNEVLVSIAAKHQKTPAQVMIRWCIERGTIPLPKSVSTTRIQENIAVYDMQLDKEDMAALAELDRNKRTCWDPTRIP